MKETHMTKNINYVLFSGQVGAVFVFLRTVKADYWVGEEGCS